MKSRLKLILYLILLAISIYLIIQALMTWASIEASKVDDYYFFVTTGQVDQPVLEVKSEYNNALR